MPFTTEDWKENYKIFSLSSVFDKNFDIRDYFVLPDDTSTAAENDAKDNKLYMLDLASKVFLYSIIETSNYFPKGTEIEPCLGIKFTVQ